uniref:Rx N-terminal domain-containing protein n=1 Tax=Oryza nivara TaxID=4536 RepID=A0A0E0I024_ORYNI
MDALLAAVASDLVGRLISFLTSKCQEHRAGDDGASRLQRALLRARVVMEEAEGRQVTSPAMLRQLRQLSWEMCRAAYSLDALRIRNAAAAASHRRRRRCQPLLLSLGGDGDVTVVESLEAALGGAKELVVLLAGCPRLSRQPYSAYLFMERCMFGRQMEKEQIVDFLLRPACSSAGDPNPGVLPVVGGPEVGKRTLVEHVCIDERVRQYFAKIHRLSSDDLMAAGDDDEHRSFGIDPSSRSLVVADVFGDVEEEPWRRLCSSLCYMFRVLAFGGADPEDRPELVTIAAEFFEGVKHFALFAAVNAPAAALRADMTARSWRRIARVVIDAHGGREHGPVGDDSYYMYRPSMDAPHCLFYDRRKLTTRAPAASTTPTVTMQDLLTGRVVPGVDTPRFDVLVWRSPIPPYCSYVATCDMGRAQQFVVASGGRRPFERRKPSGNLDHGEYLNKKRRPMYNGS